MLLVSGIQQNDSIIYIYVYVCVCVCVCVCVRVRVLVNQSCLTLCNPVDYSLPGSSVHGDILGKYTRVGCHSLLCVYTHTHTHTHTHFGLFSIKSYYKILNTISVLCSKSWLLAYFRCIILCLLISYS